MAGRRTEAHDKAKAAFEKSGRTLTAKELAKRFGLATSTIYSTTWFTKRPKKTAKAAQ